MEIDNAGAMQMQQIVISIFKLAPAINLLHTRRIVYKYRIRPFRQVSLDPFYFNDTNKSFCLTSITLHKHTLLGI